MNREQLFGANLVAAPALVVAWLAAGSAAPAPAMASPAAPILHLKQCSPLTLRSISADGQEVHFNAGGQAWYFSLHAHRLQPDSQSAGASSLVPLSTRDRRLQVLAAADGTLRWRSADKGGATRLSFCMNAETQAWVAFTPLGYYVSNKAPQDSDKNLRGDQLVGFELSEDLPRPEFFPLALLEKYLLRPHIVSRVLASMASEEQIAVEVAREDRVAPLQTSIRQLLPPLMTVVSPKNEASVSSKELTIRIRVRRLNDQPYRIRVATSLGTFQDREVPLSGSGAGNETELVAKGVGTTQHAELGFEMTIPIVIPPLDNTLTVTALSPSLEVESEPIKLKLRFTGPHEAPDLPDAYVLAIGVNNYTNQKSFHSLSHATKDANDFVDAFVAQKGRSYKNVITPMSKPGEKTTKADIEAQLDWLKEQPLRPFDLALLFLSGHGVGSEDGRYFFAPSEADSSDPSRTMVSAEKLQEVFTQRKGGRMLVFLDTCHSGGVLGEQGAMKDLAKALAKAGNVVVFTSSTGAQDSLEFSKLRNGVFTRAVVESMKGDADPDGTGRVTVTLMEYYVSKRVRQLTHDQQTPTSGKPAAIVDFDIAHVRVPPWRRRWVRWATGSVLAGALIAGSIAFGVVYHPDYLRGNTNWLVRF